jgi:hypothetical protein
MSFRVWTRLVEGLVIGLVCAPTVIVFRREHIVNRLAPVFGAPREDKEYRAAQEACSEKLKYLPYGGPGHRSGGNA